MAVPMSSGREVSQPRGMTNTANPRTPRAHVHATGWPSLDSVHVRKRRANNYMRQALQRLDPNEAIPFFCECDDPDCFVAVWLTRSAYDRLRGSSADRFLAATDPEQAAA